MTAMYMMAISSVMPTAVMIESIEKTRSSSRIWKIARAERHLHRWPTMDVLVVVGIDRVVDFLGRLPDQEQAAGDQDEVAPGEAVAEGGEQRLGQLHDEGDGGEQHQPHDQRRADAEPPRARLLLAPAACWSGSR